MLAIRMQRTGRKGHAMFRVVVQDARRTPTSGKIVARLGSYDPHAKTVTLDKEKASFYLEHGAQPSGRAAQLLKREGVKLPDWVTLSTGKERAVRNAEKRRSTRPAEPAPTEEAPAAEDTAANKTAEPAKTETEAPESEKTEDDAPKTDASDEAADEPEESPEEEPVVEEKPAEEPTEASGEAASSDAEAKKPDDSEAKKA